MIDPSKMRASDHIVVAYQLLGFLGDVSDHKSVSRLDEERVAMASTARAHIDLAKFKMDYPEVIIAANRKKG